MPEDKTDGLLAALAEHVRSEQADDAHLEAVTRGDAEGDEAFRPLGDAVVDAIVARHAPPQRSALRRAALLLGAPAAAALVVFALKSSHANDLPAYAVSASGEQATRGAPAGSKIVVGESGTAAFEILLRPETAAKQKVVAYAFAMVAGDASPLDARIDIADGGAVRVTGTSRALRGASEVRVVVGPAPAIGGFAGAEARARSAQGDTTVRVLSVYVE